MRILIVDDSKAMRMIVIRTLRQAGFGSHSFEEAPNAVEALKAVLSDAPDLVLCDWNMPEMNGLDFLKKLREEGSDIKFGFITSESAPEIKEEAEAAGALFLICKPFTVDSMESTLSPYL